MKFRWVIILLLLTALISSPFLIIPRLLKINEISCQSQFGPCSENLEQRMKSVTGKERNILETKKALAALLKNEILVNDFSFQFKFPDQLEINLLERKPKFAVKGEGKELLALVDDQGYVIVLQEASALPKLIIASSLPNVGEKLSERTLFGLELLYDMFSFYQVQTGKLENNTLVIELPDGPKVIFPLEGDRKALLGSLRLVLAKLNSDSQDSRIGDVSGVKIIDLRFKNPVIR